MARIRTIKPEFWTDSKTGTLSDKATKLFIGLLNHCDDYGVIRFDIAEFSAKIFPFENFLEHSILLSQALTDEILPKGLAIIFSHTDDEDVTTQYLWIKNFERHQKVDKPGKPIISKWESGDNPKNYATRQGIEIQEISATIRENSRTFENFRPGKGKGKGRDKEKEGNNAFCSAPEKTGAEPEAEGVAKPDHVVYEIPIVGGGKSTYPITQPMIDEWQQAYPGVDVDQALRECRQWNIANPTRRKTSSGIARHVVSWLQREQNRGGVVKRAVPGMMKGQSKTYEHNVAAISQAMLELQQEGAAK
jgi:hypothetical protein